MDMRVLMYGWEFPPRISGGLGIACYAIVKELARKNVNLTLILPQVITSESNCIESVSLVGCQELEKFSQEEFAGLVNIKCPKIPTCLHPYVSGGNFPRFISDETIGEFLAFLDQMDLSEELKALARAEIGSRALGSGLGAKYEISLITEVFRYAFVSGVLAKNIEHGVIHAHDWLTILAALEAKRFSNKPIVLHVHALETDRSGLWVDQRIFAIEKYGMEQADRIIAVSQYTKDNIVRYYGIDPNKISVVHNGIYLDTRPDDGNKSDRPKMVLFLGRITHQKGPCFFIETAKKVLEKNPDVQFVLAGTGDQLADMIERTAGLRIGKNVHFTGFIDNTKVRDIYKLADVYVMPSVSEPFGLSALEALSYDVPTVISKQSGVSEVLNHTLVADFWDTEGMAGKILALLKYPVLGQTSLKYSRDDLDEVTWEKAAEKIVAVYKDFI